MGNNRFTSFGWHHRRPIVLLRSVSIKKASREDWLFRCLLFKDAMPLYNYSSSSTKVISDVLPPDAVVSILMVFSVIKR